MTARQMKWLNVGLWPAAARFQNWPLHDRCKRLEILSQLVGRPLESSKEINSVKDFDAVRKGLQELAARIPLDDGGLAARKRQKIREHLRCLALYHPDAEGYFRQMVIDLVGHGPDTSGHSFREMPLHHLLDELSDAPKIRTRRNGDTYEASSDLERVLMTLNGRLNGKHGFRAKARDSMHEMLTKSGLKCYCASICCRPGVVRVRLPAPEPEQEMADCPF